LYNPATRKCEPIIDVPMSDKSVKDTLKDIQTGGGLVVTPYDPCKDNGYGGTYDAATNSCKKSPACGGSDLLLDSNGKMKGCKADVPTGGGVVGGVVGGTTGGTGSSAPQLVKPISGTTCPTGYKYLPLVRMCMKIEGSVQFSGKEPLTLDNLLC
jgi:hypothetical protein